MRSLLAIAVLVLVGAAGAQAEEKPVAINNAPGKDPVEGNCAACHSLDYIGTNSPYMNRKTWDAEVNKMINVFGAPIQPADAKTIVDYLVKNYGTGG